MAFTRPSPVPLLRRLVEAAGFNGDDRALTGALPHVVSTNAPIDYQAALENLGLPLFTAEALLTEISDADCPCLFLGENGQILVVLEAAKGRILAAPDGEEQPSWRKTKPDKGTIIKVLRKSVGEPDAPVRSVGAFLRDFRGVITSLFAASFFTNSMALAAPLLIMVIYDRVIPSKSVDLILSLAVAVGLIVAADLTLRLIRARHVAYMGGKVERALGLALFRKLSGLPLTQLDKSTVHEQISRLRQFEGLRDVFTGQLFLTILDLPFVALFLALIFSFSINIGLMLLGFIGVFAVAGMLTSIVQRAQNAAVGATKTAHQRLLFEMTRSQLTLQRLGAEEIWRARIAEVARASAASSRHAKQFQLMAQSLGQTLMMVAGVGTIAFGATSALNEDITFGQLIAIMALVWRVLGPVQSLYSGITQLQGFAMSNRQISRVLSLPEEFRRTGAEARTKIFDGQLEILNVTHRTDPTRDPVLSGVSVTIETGSLVMLCGHGGAGRSALLTLINRLHQPGFGSILLDGVDYRQIAADELRGAIAYAAQEPAFFHGTLRQNFLLANPILTDRDIKDMLDALDLWREVQMLPEGLDTRMDEAFQRRISRAVAKGLSLARCLVRDAPVYLFDDPCSGLDEGREHRFLRLLSAMKGRKTVLMKTDRPSHLSLADRLVFLDRGRLVLNEKRETGLKKVVALYEIGKEARDGQN